MSGGASSRAKGQPRPLTDHELDDVTAQAWLGDLRPNVYVFVSIFTYLMCNADLSEVSVIGFRWAWGRQRMSPWSSDKYWTSSGRGDGVVNGGTGQIADKLGEILGSNAQTSSKVVRAAPTATGWIVTVDAGGETQQVECNQIVSALPAPIVLDVLSDLPDWKRAALSSVRYGQYVVAPIVVSAPDTECPPLEVVPFRREIGTNWIYARPYQMSPAPLDRSFGFFTSIATDADARRIWADDDESIKSGVANVFTTLYPQLADRILYVGLKRWKHGLPQLRPGSMNRMA
ncbi:MAG: FAD-dependent oxidoreductase, partial [Ilumatobacteraceae bacterium]